VTEWIPKSIFAENLNTKFVFRLDAEKTIELELTNISEAGSAPNLEQFALLFRGPAEFYLPQQIYPLEHERLGALSIFLVPTGRDEDGFEYEAIFNRIIS